MSDESFEIEFRTTGQSDAVLAFENLKLKELEAKAETAALTAELNKLRRSGTATATDIESTSRALVRAQESARGYAREASALQVTQQAGVRTLGETGRHLNRLSGAIGQVGGVLGQINPQFATFGSALSRASTASSALAGAAGPVGIAIGAVVTAVGIAIPLMEAFGASSDSTATRLNHTARAAKNAADEIRALVGAMQAQRRAENIAAGRASEAAIGEEIGGIETRRARALGQVEQMNREIAALRERRRALEDERTRAGLTVRRGAAILGEQARIEETIARIEESRGASERRITEMSVREEQLRAQQMREVLHERLAGEEEEEQNRERRARGRRSSDADRRRAEAEALEQVLLQQRIRFAQLEAQRQERERAQFQDAQRELADWWVELDNQTIDRILDNRDRVRRKEQEQRDAFKRAEIAKAEDSKRRQEELSRITEGAWTSVGQSLQSALGDVFRLIQDGSEATGDGFLRLLDKLLESMAVEYAIKAVASTGEAVGAYARYDYSAGSQHASAAAIYAAVAAMAGGAGAAITTPSQSQAQATPVTPQSSLGAGGGQQVTVQLFAPQALFTERERGEILASGVRAARRELGPGAARL